MAPVATIFAVLDGGRDTAPGLRVAAAFSHLALAI
jgi:hypothetical protein